MRIPAAIMLFFFILVLLTGCKAAPPELPDGWEQREVRFYDPPYGSVRSPWESDSE